MIKRVIKSVVPGVFLTALLLTLPAPTQVSAQTGMGGGAGAGASGAGAAGGGYGGGFIYHPDQDSSPSRPEELHPEALTDPDLTLARHPARVTA